MNLYIFRYQKGITPHLKSRKVLCLCGFPALCLLFKFNRGRRLRRHIIAHPVHIFHLCQNPVGNLLQDLPIHPLDGSAHGVHRIDGPDNDHIFKTSGVILYAHGFKIRNHREILPDLFVQTGSGEFLSENGIRFPDSL